MKMPKMFCDTICCCVPLKSGCLTFAYIILIMKIIVLFLTCNNFLLLREIAKQQGSLDKDFLFIRGLTIIYMIIQIAEILLAIVLLEGLHKNEREKIRAFVIGAAALYALLVVILVAVLVRYASVYSWTQWFRVGSEIVFGGIYIYFILVLRSYYLNLEESALPRNTSIINV